MQYSIEGEGVFDDCKPLSGRENDNGEQKRSPSLDGFRICRFPGFLPGKVSEFDKRTIIW